MNPWREERDTMSVAFSASPLATLRDEQLAMKRNWGMFVVFGVLSIIAGLLAISSTFIATLVSVRVFGWLLLFAGITEVIHAVMVRNFRGFALHLLAAALYLLVGLFMLEDPIRAAAVLTLLLAASFFVGGALRIIFSVAVRFPAWPWFLLNGVVDLILGTLIVNGWPESSLWVIGLFVGIDLLFHGWSCVILALAARSYTAPQSV
jgi:uncharacterized membrane protein HdeD (DUF308 family)